MGRSWRYNVDMTLLRAHFDGKVLVPHEPVDLPQGTELQLQVTEVEFPRGSPQAILKAMSEPPHVTREDIEALEKAIEEGKLPPTDKGCFDE
jgi:hypothetical protein